MNRFKKYNILLWLIIIILVVSNAVTVYLLVFNNREITSKIKSNIASEIAGIEFPLAINGTDGKNATDEQVFRAVSDYFRLNPVYYPKDGDDGYTPVKNKDYFDGTDGTTPPCLFTMEQCRGKDGKDGESIQGEKGIDGLTPQIRCNTSKNVWQVRYSDADAWQLLNGDRVACTIPGLNP